MAFRKGFEARDTMNQYLRQLSVSDTLDATMKTWITQKYTCVEESAVQLDGQFIIPFLWISLGVFATSIIMRIIERKLKSNDNK